MTLHKLPDYRDTVIVVGSSVRKPLPVLKAHLESLAWQELPPRTRLHFVYVPDFLPEQRDAQEYLFKWLGDRGGEMIRGLPLQANDFSDAPGLDSHQWTQSSMARVGHHKNLIIQYALNYKADYYWNVDCDLILDTTCLASLLSVEKPLATAVFWTKWSKRGTETTKVHAAPQTWLRHPYSLDGRGMDEAEFRQKLLSRGVTRVWGFGACTLIRRNVLEAGVDFSYLPDVPLNGLMAGEDRHFCIKAERLHIEAVADSWPDIQHIYHADEDVPQIPQFAARLSQKHPDRARLGDLVSLRLRPLEPIPVGPGRYQQPAPQLVRGRLGQIAMLPELEEAVYSLNRGDKTVIRAHFPVHYPVPFLRNKMRLIEVSLLDVKKFSLPPVVESEFFIGPRSAATADMTTLDAEQHDSIKELAGA